MQKCILWLVVQLLPYGRSITSNTSLWTWILGSTCLTLRGCSSKKSLFLWCPVFPRITSRPLLVQYFFARAYTTSLIHNFTLTSLMFDVAKRKYQLHLYFLNVWCFWEKISMITTRGEQFSLLKFKKRFLQLEKPNSHKFFLKQTSSSFTTCETRNCLISIF